MQIFDACWVQVKIITNIEKKKQIPFVMFKIIASGK